VKNKFWISYRIKKRITLLLLIIIISTGFNNLYSQNIQPKPTRQSSFEAFSKGNYEQAYKEFSELLLTYSKDPLYKYYSGVCLVKLNRKPGEAIVFLKQALQGAAVVKTLPSDGFFYLGRAQQMAGMFKDALESFNLYTEEVGKKAAREMGTPSFIKQCNEKTGAISEPEVILSENLPPKKDLVPIVVKKDTSSLNDLPAGYEKILDEALDYQFEADSIANLKNDQKKEMAKLPNTEKAGFKNKISENELLSSAAQMSADQKYNEAQVFANPDHSKIPGKDTVELIREKVLFDSTKIPEKKVLVDSAKLTEKSVKLDSTKQAGNKDIKETAKKPDSTNLKNPVILPGSKEIKEPVKQTVKQPGNHADTLIRNISVPEKPAGVFAFFEVIPTGLSKIIIEPEVPAGLVYRIQIAVFRNPVAPGYFKGISPVYGFKIKGTDKTNYYAGMFRKSSDANKALAAVKAKGFKDSFVIALSDNKPVSADRAVIMEKEWGNKSFINQVAIVPETPVDTVPPMLALRVEVVRSLKPLKDEVVLGIEKMAGNRGFEIKNLDDGSIAYLIGEFITFESASEYADLLIRNGYREARVVAWLGKKEIPVETAKQLFEKME
jgi:hypothetical protein